MGQAHLSRNPTNSPTDRSSPSATSDSGAPRLYSSLPSSVWNPLVSTRQPTTPSCSVMSIFERIFTPTPCFLVVPQCSQESRTECREKVLCLDRWLYPVFTFDLPANVDLEAGIRRIGTFHRPQKMLLSKKICISILQYIEKKTKYSVN